MGTYLGPSKRKQDKHKELHYVQWDDGSNVKVQLNDMRHYDGEDVAAWPAALMVTCDSSHIHSPSIGYQARQGRSSRPPSHCVR